jgi:hypothetical protein
MQMLMTACISFPKLFHRRDRFLWGMKGNRDRCRLSVVNQAIAVNPTISKPMLDATDSL